MLIWMKQNGWEYLLPNKTFIIDPNNPNKKKCLLTLKKWNHMIYHMKIKRNLIIHLKEINYYLMIFHNKQMNVYHMNIFLCI